MALDKRLRAFVRLDGSGRIVPGSTVLRRNKPRVGRWQENTAYECCGPVIAPVVSDPVVGTVTATTIDITWSAATTSPGQNEVAYYVVKLDTVQQTVVPATDPLSYQFTGLTASTSYDITVEACTADGCYSSNIVTQATTA